MQITKKPLGKNKIIHAAFIGLLIALIIILCKNVLSPYTLRNATYGIPALEKRGSITNLYIGSSMFRQGIDPDVMSRHSPEGTDYILAYNGNQPALEYIILCELVEQNVTIENLYIDMYAYSASESPKLEDEKLLMELPIKKKKQLYKLLAPYEHNAASPFSSWTNSFRFFMDTFVLSNNEQYIFAPIVNPILNSQFRNGGSLVVSNSNTSLTPDITPPFLDSVINQSQQDSIQAIINVCNYNNINLIFVETPKYISVESSPQYGNIMKQYNKLLAENNIKCVVCQLTYENLESPTNCMSYAFEHDNSSLFHDQVHLSYDGKKCFSELLSQISTQ